MNQRERLLSVFAGKTPDKTPWYGDLSYWYDSQQRQGKLEEKYQGEEGYLRLHQDTGIGIYYYAPSIYKTEYEGNIEYINSEDAGLRVTKYITPQGTITAKQKYSKETYSYVYQEHFIKDIDDLKIMEYVFNNTNYKPDYDEFIRIDKLWGEWGLPVILAPISVSPIQKLLARWAGVETTVQLMMDNPGEFDRIIEAIKKSEDRVFEIISDGPGKMVAFPENLSSEVTGKMLYNKYSKDYYQKRIDQLHCSGKYTTLHIDGTLKPLLPLLPQTGLDAAEAVTPSPVGDVELEDLKELAGDRMIIWGGLPGALFSPAYSDDYFDEFIKRILDNFSVGSRFVLGVADQVPPDGRFSRMCRVREILE